MFCERIHVFIGAHATQVAKFALELLALNMRRPQVPFHMPFSFMCVIAGLAMEGFGIGIISIHVLIAYIVSNACNDNRADFNSCSPKKTEV